MIIGLAGSKSSGKDSTYKYVSRFIPKSTDMRLALYVKNYCHDVFGIPLNQLYGTEEEKNQLINIRWEDLPIQTSASGRMSARQFVQIFATEICRRIDPACFIRPLFRDIAFLEENGYENFFVVDVRFINEVDAIHARGGKVVRFLRKPHQDGHVSECELDHYDGFDAVIDNWDMTVDEKNEATLEILEGWGL